MKDLMAKKAKRAQLLRGCIELLSTLRRSIKSEDILIENLIGQIGRACPEKSRAEAIEMAKAMIKNNPPRKGAKQ